jgi:hypothetical protein
VSSLSRGIWGDIDRDFVSGSLSPAFGPGFGSTDVKETEKSYELHVDVPGLTKEDVKVPRVLLFGKVSNHVVDASFSQLYTECKGDSLAE